MLVKAKTINGYKLNCKDGEIGKVEEFYFDDDYWTIRYLIAETGNWLIDKQVLVSPHSLESVNKDEGYININLTKKQIEESPSIENEKPVSRQYETKLIEYFGWPQYWVGPYMWGIYPYIGSAGPEMEEGQKHDKREKQPGDSHLRSTHSVRGYKIHAKDGEIGHVYDFIIDDRTWNIRYLVIDTKNWLPGKKVLVSPRNIRDISWSAKEVFTDLLKDDIMNAPEYTDETVLSEEYEDSVSRHYS